jgi:aminoglycoside phosphotransferase (APT) family kinase protein
MAVLKTPARDTDPALSRWLAEALGEQPLELRPLAGGQSNETLLLRTDAGLRVVRRPPAAPLDPRAHSMEREHRVLTALEPTDVPAPRALFYGVDAAGRPTLVMEHVEGFPPRDRLPDAYAEDVRGAGEAIVDALAALHTAPWRELGLGDFGRPDGFLARQVGRWRSQFERSQVRELPWFDEVARWLEENRPPETEPAIFHGDFHADNCLLSLDAPPRVEAIVDWEMATIGDPLLDLGLLLAFWGPDRRDPPAMARVQGFTRADTAQSRSELAARYAERTGRSVEHLPYYLALATWKLAAIVEGAYAQYVSGKVSSDYARSLEHDVPAALEEAAGFAGLA